MNKAGLHLRFNASLLEAINKALRLKLPFFQCFLMTQESKYVDPHAAEIQEFLRLRRLHFNNLYVHGSYWINAAGKNSQHPVLRKELYLAQKLEFTHVVLHPGCANECASRSEGIDNLATLLNELTKKNLSVKIVLENSAHSNFSIGGDLNDFNILLAKLDKPDTIAFCIDTAHAYAYGYDLANPENIDEFIKLIDQLIGLERVALIHLNDAHEPKGSRIDRHAVLGQGGLGKEALKKFICSPVLRVKPVLMELPCIDEEQEKALVEEVNSWLKSDKGI
jgi:deoxyribonuclease-4